MRKISTLTQLEKLVEIGCGKDLADDFLVENSHKKIIFISDEKIWKNCKSFFSQDFSQKFNKFLLLKNPKADEKNLKKIAAKLKNIDLIFALGSGTINDLCKYNSAQKNIPYVIFASAASMNGYLSKNASIAIKNHKKTLPATLPEKVFCNLDILKSAPTNLTKAGIGDVMCFYSCYFDWYLSHKILGTKFDEKTLKISQQKIDFFIKNYHKFSLKNDKLLHLLIELLLISGYAMTMAGGSYPASQSEHMIAHTIEMKFPKIAEKLLHGQTIAVTSLSALKMQNAMLDAIPKLKLLPNYKKNVSIFFGEKLGAECIAEYEQKLHSIKFAKNLDKKSLQKLRAICMKESVLKNIFLHFKIKTSAKSLTLSSQQYQACIAHAKFMRNRFTCLDFF